MKQYCYLSRAFGWTPGEIDDIELEMFFDYMTVAEVVAEEEEVVAEEEKDKDGKPSRRAERGTAQDLFMMVRGQKGVSK